MGEEDERAAAGLSDAVPVALIDPRTLKGLGRLGAGSPIAEADTLFEAAPPVEIEPLLLRQAREKIRAAGLLIQQSCLGPAVELLSGGLLAAVAHLAGETAAPEPQRAGVWLYGEILPRGLLDQNQAALMARALALAQSGSDLPEAMVRELAGDAEGFVGRCTASP